MQEIRIKWTLELREYSRKLHDPYLVKHKKKFRETYHTSPNGNMLLQYVKSISSSSMDAWSGFAKEIKKQNEINPKRENSEQKKPSYNYNGKRKTAYYPKQKA